MFIKYSVIVFIACNLLELIVLVTQKYLFNKYDIKGIFFSKIEVEMEIGCKK